MPRGGKSINYTELVYHVMRDAHAPLALDEVVAGVQGLEPIHVANPRALILHIVEQSGLILPVDGDRYGYLPHLLEGNSFRQPLPDRAQEQGYVELSPDALAALWPGWWEAQREHESRAAILALPGGPQARLQRHFRLSGRWGFTAGPEFWRWLEAAGPRQGDDLIIRVVDADARRYTGELERRQARDEQALARRNREAGDRALLAVRAAGGEILADRLAPVLIAAGAYRDPIPPDPLITLLAQDGRFIDAGLGVVALLEQWTEADERLADERQHVMWEALGEVRPRFRRASPEPGRARQESTAFARLIMDDRLEEAVAWLQQENRIHSGEQGEVTVDLAGLLDDLPGAATAEEIQSDREEENRNHGQNRG